MSSPPIARRQRTDTGSTSHSEFITPLPRRKRRSTDSTVQSGMTFDSAEEEWEGAEIPSDDGSPQRRRKKKDEPMSPVVVVLYVTALYLIFQILTRSDELEILSHLPPTSSLFASSSPLGLGGSNLHSDLSQPQHPYHMPYHLPQIPSPLPRSSSSDEAGISIGRMILGVVVYPLYLIITLLAIPMPFLLNTLHLVYAILNTMLFPITSSVRFLLKTFVIAPLGLVRSILAVFYPLYTFVGGVIGFGCVMGLGAGWLGRVGMDWLVYNRQDKKSKSKRSSSKRERSTTTSYLSSGGSKRKGREEPKSTGHGHGLFRLQVNTDASKAIPKSTHHRHRSSSGSENEQRILTPNPVRSAYFDQGEKDIRRDRERRERMEKKHQSMYEHIELAGFGDGLSYRNARGTSREPQVLGTRRRVHALGQR